MNILKPPEGAYAAPLPRMKEEEEAEVFVPIPIDWYAAGGESAVAGADDVDDVDEESECISVHDCSDDEENEEITSSDCVREIPESIETPREMTQDSLVAAVQTIPPPYSPAVHHLSKTSLLMLPLAARELLAASMNRMCYTARLSYALSRRNRKYTELGNHSTGFSIARTPQQSSRNNNNNSERQIMSDPQNNASDNGGGELELPCFSSLSWVERQLVEEWRTYRPNHRADSDATTTDGEDENDNEEEEHGEDDDLEFALARTLVPLSAPRPTWQEADACLTCRQQFGPARLRHHCRLCGNSFCHPHCSYTHSLPQLGYDPSVPERVCDSCKSLLVEQNLAERVAWRLARCRDYQQGTMEPYFETGCDSIEQVLLRITEAALAVGRSIPLGAQAAVAVETVDVLRKYGLNGVYTILMRKDFLAAADLLRKALGINQSAWPLSVHELSAAIFYALAQHRAMRGLYPEREHLIHTYAKESRKDAKQQSAATLETDPAAEDKNLYHNDAMISDLLSDDGAEAAVKSSVNKSAHHPSRTADMPPLRPVCEPVSDETLSSLIFYAPMALNFMYASKEVDMQLLAAQQGWRLVYAYMEQDLGHKSAERPVSALFVHEEQRIACIGVRGTATIHDVITDIRQTPVPFPDEEDAPNKNAEGDWTTVFRGQGLAVCGMAAAALNLYREHIDSLLFYARQGYRIRLTGHSLGGGVSVLLGALVYRDLERELDATSVPLKVYAYGTPSCIDARLAESVESFVVTVVLHDDVIPRLTPTACRNLLKHLLTIRETWVKDHFPEDFLALQARAKTAWAPTFRTSFTLRKSSIKTFCRRKLQSSRRKLMFVTEKLINEAFPPTGNVNATHEQSSNAFYLETGMHESDSLADAPEDDAEFNAQYDNDEQPRLLLDYMGGIDDRSTGLVIDGDEFFDPDDDLLEGSDDGDSVSSVRSVLREHEQQQTESMCNEGEFDDSQSGSHEDDDNDSPTGAIMLEETPLPRMFVPGKIVHIYAHRGVYRCAYVPRAFKELRRISMAGNMLSDHKSAPYYDALLELRSVRQAAEHPPRWTAFDEDDTCSCCASRFTWASTSNSQAQEARDKHNCRSCGTLVCDPCSKNRLALPSIGLCVPSRVCDRCYNDINGLRRTGDPMTSSYISSSTARGGPAAGAKKPALSTHAMDGNKPVRERERRSAVVDELASRIQASPLTCSH